MLKNRKGRFDCRDTRFKTVFLNNLQGDFGKTPIGKNVVLFDMYNFVKSHGVMFCVTKWFKFEFSLLSLV